MGLLNFAASKILGVPTPAEICDNKLFEVLERNGVSDWRFSIHKIDRSDFNHSFYVRNYVGIGKQKGNRIGFVVSIDEEMGAVQGCLVDQAKATWHKTYAREYRLSKVNKNHPDAFSFYSFHDYLVDKCGGSKLDLN